jgi:hypothetical protein
MGFEVRMPKVKKKKPTEREMKKLREIFVKIWNNPEAMRQAKMIARC